MAMRYSPLPLVVRTIPFNLIGCITAHLNADSYLFLCFVGLLGIPGGTGSIFVSRLSTAWHLATSANPRNMPTASAGAGVFISQSGHSRHDKLPSPRTVMLVLLLVSLPVGLVYFLVLRISAWLAASFTFSMLALTFLCIAVRLPYPSPLHVLTTRLFCRSLSRWPRHISLLIICANTGTTQTCM